MKIDGLDWMDWLHKIRRDLEEERKRKGLSEVEWLGEIQSQARAFMRERSAKEPTMARDGKKET